MNYKHLFIYIITIISLVFSSCTKKYEREKLLNLYINRNKSKFSYEDSFYLLVLRNFELSCSATKYGYNKDLALSFTLNNIKGNLKIFVLSDNKISLLKLSTSYSNYKNLYFVYDNPNKLDQYGFYYSPHLFQIKNYKLYYWSNIEKYSRLLEDK